MKTYAYATLATLALFGINSAAAAAITVSQGPYYTYGADLAAVSAAHVICDFDGASNCAAGYSLTFSGGNAPGTGVFNGSQPGITAAPPGDTTNYLSVLGPDGQANLTFTTGIQNLSFFMGSPDQFNTVQFFGPANTLIQAFDGSTFTGPPANGNQALGERINFSFNGANVTRVQFTSTENSFELDRIATGAVPEPMTWALMLIGFGGVGAVIRARKARGVMA